MGHSHSAGSPHTTLSMTTSCMHATAKATHRAVCAIQAHPHAKNPIAKSPCIIMIWQPGRCMEQSAVGVRSSQLPCFEADDLRGTRKAIISIIKQAGRTERVQKRHSYLACRRRAILHDQAATGRRTNVIAAASQILQQHRRWRCICSPLPVPIGLEQHLCELPRQPSEGTTPRMGSTAGGTLVQCRRAGGGATVQIRVCTPSHRENGTPGSPRSKCWRLYPVLHCKGAKISSGRKC